MILIQKKQEPNSLMEYKKQKNAYYDGCNKQDIRKNLLEEQGHLCAYCMRRIHIDEMKIEHWCPQEKLSDASGLDYRNMLGVCLGEVKGQTGKEHTCDVRKANQRIVASPLEESTISSIFYNSKNGEIHSTNSRIENDLVHTLNLNSKVQNLPLNRKRKIDEVIMELSKRSSREGTWSKSKLENFVKKYSQLDEEGCKAEYLGIITWYFNRKLKKSL
ncbi:MAG: retron system putative HNH endonuclease [Eubacteriales bacterium]